MLTFEKIECSGAGGDVATAAGMVCVWRPETESGRRLRVRSRTSLGVCCWLWPLALARAHLAYMCVLLWLPRPR
eukprot:4536841-Prymnesium_polylepis.1